MLIKSLYVILFQDGSTMLIEAAKGGHTTVVNLLLDWPGNLTSASSDLTQHSPPQSLNVNEVCTVCSTGSPY